jgi:hypothetical protein
MHTLAHMPNFGLCKYIRASAYLKFMHSRRGKRGGKFPAAHADAPGRIRVRCAREWDTSPYDHLLHRFLERERRAKVTVNYFTITHNPWCFYLFRARHLTRNYIVCWYFCSPSRRATMRSKGHPWREWYARDSNYNFTGYVREPMSFQSFIAALMLSNVNKWLNSNIFIWHSLHITHNLFIVV